MITTGETRLADAADSAAFLNSLIWHDSVLYDIRVVRERSADLVVLTAAILTSSTTQVSRRMQLAFENCRLTLMTIHGGVICMSDGEMISSARASVTGQLIARVEDTWKLINLAGRLAEFEVDLASTGSTVQLVFERLSVKTLTDDGSHPAPPPLPFAK